MEDVASFWQTGGQRKMYYSVKPGLDIQPRPLSYLSRIHVAEVNGSHGTIGNLRDRIGQIGDL